MFHDMRPRVCRALLGSAVLAGLGSSARADTVSIQPITDNTLFSTGDTSNGAGPQFFSGRTGSFRGFIMQRAVMEFDVAGAVPAGATITAVTLTLHLERTGNEVSETHSLHRVLAEWGEGTSAAGGGTGGPATAGDATWFHTFFPGEFWTAEGGDFDAAASAAQVVPPMEINAIPVTWGSTPGMVADVQRWLDQPGDNHGWLLMGNESGANTARKFSSREHPEPSQRPMLTIDYEAAPPPAACPGDVNEDGVIDVADLLLVVHPFGANGDAPEDVDDDGVVAVGDLLIVVRSFGPCDPPPPPPVACPGDLNGDGVVNVADMLRVIHAFSASGGAAGDAPEDLTGDGAVDVRDLLHIMTLFGPCP